MPSQQFGEQQVFAFFSEAIEDLARQAVFLAGKPLAGLSTEERDEVSFFEDTGFLGQTQNGVVGAAKIPV